MKPQTFIRKLSASRFDHVFNPYTDRCTEFDRVEAPDVRRQNLKYLLEAAISARTDTIWVARDLGYRGGRRTGVALTDDVHLAAVSAMFGGIPLERPTQGEAVAERTAAVIWRVLTKINRPVFLWNVFPFHPHEPGNAFSNRSHTRAERVASLPLLFDLIEMLNPKRLVAIGRDAQEALTDLDIDVIGVRHPSYGGQREFLEGVCAIHGVGIDGEDDCALPLLSRNCAAESAAA